MQSKNVYFPDAFCSVSNDFVDAAQNTDEIRFLVCPRKQRESTDAVQ